MNGVKRVLPCLGGQASMHFGNIEILTNLFSPIRNVFTVNDSTEQRLSPANQDIVNVGAIEMSAHVLVRAKYLNAFQALFSSLSNSLPWEF